LSPSRIAKRVLRRLVVSWREQPTRYDIEALQANMRRVGLVIRVRWALVAALASFSILAAWAYALQTPLAELWANMRIPAFALVFVLIYNTYYQLTYRMLGNIAILNHAQLLFDAIVVTVLVYYSGGVHSWFWAMYSLFILEAAFILPKRRHTWLMAGVCAALVGGVVAIRYLWQLTVFAGTATVATLMTAAIREREAELAAASIVDDKTGLYDRHYFLRALGSELTRADQDGRPVHVLLVDIDDFGEFNRLVGIDKGDRMLRKVADTISSSVEDRCPAGANVVSRFGGEEFAIVFAACEGEGNPTEQDALALAEAIRLAVAEVRIDDAGVTVSSGVASFPRDGATRDQLLDAVDEALLQAVSKGGNAVASTLPA
jgi:diguanylate cyclase (GGDEF)-like protein